MQPIRHFNTSHRGGQQIKTLEERVVALTFRKQTGNQDEFNYERNVIQRLKSQQNQQDDNEEDVFMCKLNQSPQFTCKSNLFYSQVQTSQRTVINEFMTLIFRQRENCITYDEFYILLSKLEVCSNPEINLYWFRQLDSDNDNLVHLADIQFILNQDLLSGGLVDLIEPELILRVALEMFQCLSEEQTELNLKKVMNFIKFKMRETIDFLETIEMFGFVQNLYHGQVKTNVSLQNFLQIVCPQLKKSLSKVLLRKCNQICQECLVQDQTMIKKHITNPIQHKRHGLHSRNTNPVEQLFQLKAVSRQSSPFQTQHNESFKSDVEKLLQKNFHLNLEVEVQDQNNSKINEQEQIVNYLKENRPKIKGWLQRLSTNKANKWSLLFFQIDHHSKCLKAVKPLRLKKTIESRNAEFELINSKNRPQHRKVISQDMNKILGAQLNENNFQLASQSLKDAFEYFIIKADKQKPFILRSYDAVEILTMVNEIQSAFITDKNLKLVYEEHLTYTGVVCLAEFSHKDYKKQIQEIDKLHFKDYLLVIKDGKLLFYPCEIKHELPLEQLSIVADSTNLSFVPSHPFPFQLIQREVAEFQQIDYLQVNKKKIEVQLDGDVQEIQGSVIMWQIDEDDNESENDNKKEKLTDKKGVFGQLKNKLSSQRQSLIKETRLIFAAESELKRRQWIFSINYYKSSRGREVQDFIASKSNKSSYSYQAPSFHYQTPLPSQQNCQQTPLRSSMFRSLHSQTNQLFIGGNHTHINMNVLNLGVDNDYYDIFKDKQSQYEYQQGQNFQNNFDEPHCHTDPNEQNFNKQGSIYQQQSQELQRLITLPSKEGFSSKLNQNKQINQLINGTTNLELWQKFILSFFRYLSSRRKPTLVKNSQEFVHEESQEPQAQKLHNRRLNVCKPK